MLKEKEKSGGNLLEKKIRESKKISRFKRDYHSSVAFYISNQKVT